MERQAEQTALAALGGQARDVEEGAAADDLDAAVLLDHEQPAVAGVGHEDGRGVAARDELQVEPGGHRGAGQRGQRQADQRGGGYAAAKERHGHQEEPLNIAAA